MVAVMVQVTGWMSVPVLCQNTDGKQSRDRGPDLALPDLVTLWPPAPRQHQPGYPATRDRKQSHPHTSSRSSRWGDQNSAIVFICKASLFSLSLYYSSLFSHLYLHIFKTDICSIDNRYINIGHISELRIFGSICPCYETRAIFSGGIRLDTVKHWLEIRAGQRRYLSTISTSSERFYLPDYGL